MGCTRKMNDLRLTTADVVEVPVTLSQGGQPYSLVGLTVTCWVGGQQLATEAVAIDDAADGRLTLRIDVPALGLPVGESGLELRAAEGELSWALITARVLVRQSQQVA